MVPIADRTTKVSLVAQVSGYVAGMEAAAKKTREVGSEAEKLGQKKKSFDELGRASLAVGAVAAAGIALAIAKYAEFDQAMSQVKAATQETTANMNLLRAAALEAGAKTQYSATEAANAIEELGKAGLTTEQILSGGLDGALTLAAAGGIGVADAAQTAAIAMKQFGLEGSALPHVADLLAAGAGKAVGDVSDLSAALNQAGLVANGAGQSIEDTTGVLAAFADAGLLGSDAGTSLKTAIIALQAPTQKSKDLMDKYHLSFYDANGEMLSFAGIAGQLKTNLGDLDDETRNAALAQIFGNDALRSANVLYKEGADGIQEYIDQTNDSGYAAKVAADRTNNLAGDIERLGGSLDTALIQTGSGANDVLRGIVQSVGFLVDSFGSLPGPVLGAALAVGAVAAAVALAGGAALIAVPKLAAFKEGLKTLDVSAKGAATAIGLIGGAVTLATLVIGGLVQQSAEQAAMVDSLADSYDKASGKATKYTRELVSQKLAQTGAYEVAKKAGVSQKELTDAVMEGGDALQRMRDKLAGENNVFGVFDGTSLAAYNAAQGVRDLGDALETSKRQHKDLAEAGGDAAAKEEAVAQATAEATQAQQDWIDAVAKSDASFIDLDGAYDAAKSKAEELARSTGESTGKVGEALQGMVDGAKVTTGDYILELQKQVDAQTNWETNMVLLSARVPAAMIEELHEAGPKGAAEVALMASMTDEELQKTVTLWQQRGHESTSAFGNALHEAGPVITAAGAQLGQDTANEIARKLATGEATVEQIIRDYGIKIASNPPKATVVVDPPDVRRAADTLNAFANQYKTITVTAIMRASGIGDIDHNPNTPYATGGRIVGPGTGTSDSVPIRASNGEFIVNAAATARNLDLLEAINSGQVRRYASGGFVSAPPLVRGGGNSGPASVVYEQHFHMPPVPTQDPQAAATVIGREFARQAASV